MVASVVAVTLVVLTVNVAVVAPMATETLAGTVALFEDDASFTLIAPLLVPGVALRVTVPAEDCVPSTVVGESVRLSSWNGFTVRTADSVRPLKVALIVVDCVDVTSKWVTVNVAIDVPDATVTEASTVAAFVLELFKVTLSPADAAKPLRVIVPVTVVCEPPTTEDVVSASPVSVGGSTLNAAV